MIKTPLAKRIKKGCKSAELQEAIAAVKRFGFSHWEAVAVLTNYPLHFTWATMKTALTTNNVCKRVKFLLSLGHELDSPEMKAFVEYFDKDVVDYEMMKE